jgi:hypothetical protein
VNGKSFWVKPLGPSLNRAVRRIWAKIAEEASAQDSNRTLIPSPTARKEEEREWLALVYEDKPVAFASVTVDRNWIEKKGENVGFIDDFMIIPLYKEGAAILIGHCLSYLRDKGVERVIPRSRGFPALQREEFEIPPPFALPNNPPWYMNLFCESGFTPDKDWVILYIPTLPSKSKLSHQIEPDTQEFLHRINVEFRRLDIGNRNELKQYSDLLDKVFTPHFGYNPGGFVGHANSFWRHTLIRIMCRLLRIRIYVGLMKGEMVGCFCFVPDITAATRLIKRRSGIYSVLSLVDMVKFITSIRKIKRIHVESMGLKPEARILGYYIAAILDYGTKLIVDEGYEEALLGPMLVENLPIINIALKWVGKTLDKGECTTQRRRAVVENLWHTIGDEKEATKAHEKGGGVKILRYCTLLYQF